MIGLHEGYAGGTDNWMKGKSGSLNGREVRVTCGRTMEQLRLS
jgi:hypothetical protein